MTRSAGSSRRSCFAREARVVSAPNRTVAPESTSAAYAVSDLALGARPCAAYAEAMATFAAAYVSAPSDASLSLTAVAVARA